jgi:hypothetical protein
MDLSISETPCAERPPSPPLIQRTRTWRRTGPVKTFPCLFVYEEGQREDAYIGWITGLRRRSNTVRIEFEIEKNLPPLPRSEIAKLSAALDIGRYALTHTHWAVKDIQLIPALIKAGLLDEKKVRRQGLDSKIVQFGLMTPNSELSIRPSVFRAPSGNIETNLVSVMMPFEMTFDRVHNAVKAACGTAAFLLSADAPEPPPPWLTMAQSWHTQSESVTF